MIVLILRYCTQSFHRWKEETQQKSAESCLVAGDVAWDELTARLRMQQRTRWVSGSGRWVSRFEWGEGERMHKAELSEMVGSRCARRRVVPPLTRTLTSSLKLWPTLEHVNGFWWLTKLLFANSELRKRRRRQREWTVALTRPVRRGVFISARSQYFAVARFIFQCPTSNQITQSVRVRTHSFFHCPFSLPSSRRWRAAIKCKWDIVKDFISTALRHVFITDKTCFANWEWTAFFTRTLPSHNSLSVPCAMLFCLGCC